MYDLIIDVLHKINFFLSAVMIINLIIVVIFKLDRMPALMVVGIVGEFVEWVLSFPIEWMGLESYIQLNNLDTIAGNLFFLITIFIANIIAALL